ncbi:MAG: ATP-binding protein [Minisyncoccia bacterium]
MPLGLFFVTYFLVAYAGSYIYPLNNSFPGVVFAPAGIAIAGLVLGGKQLWPAITVAAFLASYAIGLPPLAAFFLAIAQTLQALAGKWMLRAVDFNPLLRRLQDIISIVIVAILPTFIVPTAAGLIHIYLLQTLSLSQFWNVWGVIWVGQILSVIVTMPFAVRWFSYPTFHRTRRESLEIGAALCVLLVFDVFIYFAPLQTDYIPLEYLILIPFTWIALRIGPRFMTVAILLNAFLQIMGTVLNNAAYPGPASLEARLFRLEIAVAIMSFIFLVLAAIAEELKEIGKNLRKQVARLEEALERIRREEIAKNEFIAVLAHELRNPLAPIVSSLELIELEKVRGGRKWLNVIKEQTTTIRRLLDDLLDISRISQRKLKLEKEEINVLHAIRMSLQTAEPMIQSRAHSLVLSLPKRAIKVHADPVRLQQIFVNLLNNAARYTEPGGTLTVSCHKEGTTVVIQIQDTGMGIAPEMLERIFEPFIQAGNRKLGSAGLGIGLALTRQLVDMHWGTIEAQSKGLGLGSSFTVRLPLFDTMRRTPQAPSVVTTVTTPSSMHTTLRILIVDDNEEAAEGISKLLQYRGHTTHSVHRGGEVPHSVQTFKPDAIVLDIGLPDMNGYEVAKRLRGELASKAMLIALTGYSLNEDKERTKEAGFDYHLTKPIGILDLDTILGNIRQINTRLRNRPQPKHQSS